MMDDADKKLMKTLEQGIQQEGKDAIDIFVTMTVESFIQGIHSELSELADEVMSTKDFERGQEHFDALIYVANKEFAKLMMYTENLADKYDIEMPKQDFVIESIDRVTQTQTKLSMAGMIFKTSFMETIDKYLEQQVEEKTKINEQFDDIVKNINLNVEEE